MDMLLLRITLAPLLVGLTTAAQRRWGDSVGGSLAGLPLTSGPVVMVLLLQHGADFAAAASAATVTGLLSGGAFCAGYALASCRTGWRGALLCGLSSFAVCTLISWWCAPSLVTSLLLLALGLPPALWRWPAGAATPPDGAVGARRPEPASAGMTCRMACAALMVLLLTGVSGWAGPRLAGLLAPLQVIAAVMAVSTHRTAGAPAARVFLRGVLRGGFAFAAFFTVLALALPRHHPLPALLAAGCLALLVQLFLLLRRTVP